jgi:hypothetical protein
LRGSRDSTEWQGTEVSDEVQDPLSQFCSEPGANPRI